MAKRARALRKATASSKRGRERRSRSVASRPPHRQVFPELYELPFVKPKPGCETELELLSLYDIDYWAPEIEGESIDQEFRGGMYALLTAEFLARHRDDYTGGSAFLSIMDAIAAKGGLWPSKRGDERPGSSVVVGFVATIRDLVGHAAATSIARNYARARGDHLAAVLEDKPPRLRAHRASLERAAESFRSFAAGRTS
jgi:hypothetical protein